MIIPPERLTMEVLRSIVESYVSREGTDYGEVELSLDEKVDSLLPSIYSGEVLLVYGEASQSVNLVPKQQLTEAETAECANS